MSSKIAGLFIEINVIDHIKSYLFLTTVYVILSHCGEYKANFESKIDVKNTSNRLVNDSYNRQ